MTWFFAILIVLAMGAVAAVAAGHGRPMADAYDDRPDALVPEEGRLTGDDLRRVRFSVTLRGYRMSEVDALLDRLASERDAEPGSEAEYAARDRDLDSGDTQRTPDTQREPAPRRTPAPRRPPETPHQPDTRRARDTGTDAATPQD